MTQNKNRGFVWQICDFYLTLQRLNMDDYPAENYDS